MLVRLAVALEVFAVPIAPSRPVDEFVQPQAPCCPQPVDRIGTWPRIDAPVCGGVLNET